MPQESLHWGAAPGFALVVVVVVAVVVAVVAGCAGREPRPIEFETGPRAEVTAEGLHRVANSRFRDVWVRAGADLAAYDAVQLVLLEPRYRNEPTATVSERTVRNDFVLSEKQKERLQKLLREVFTVELEASPYLRVVDEPGPRVLRAEARIVDLVVKVPSEIRGNEQTFTNSTADMSLLLELSDSATGALLARLSDQRDALAPGRGGHGNAGDLYLSNPATDTAALRLAFRRWARLLRGRLDDVHELAVARD